MKKSEKESGNANQEDHTQLYAVNIIRPNYKVVYGWVELPY